MKYMIAAMLLFLAIVTTAQAQKNGSAETLNADAQAVADLDAQLRAGIMANDTAALDPLIDSKWVDTDEHGNRNNKQGFFAVLKSGDLKIESIKVLEVHYNTYGDVVVMWGRAEQKASFKGQPSTVVVKFTDTFLKRNAKWKILASHRTAS
jgi:hypothetical protein